MCRDLDLSIEDTKEQQLEGVGVQSKDLFQYLLSRSHNDEDKLLINIMNYVRVVESRNIPLQSKSQALGVFGERSLSKATIKSENDIGGSSSIVSTRPKPYRVCYNCRSKTHIAPSCPLPKRPRGACYNCGSTTDQRSGCPEKTQ